MTSWMRSLVQCSRISSLASTLNWIGLPRERHRVRGRMSAANASTQSIGRRTQAGPRKPSGSRSG